MVFKPNQEPWNINIWPSPFPTPAHPVYPPTQPSYKPTVQINMPPERSLGETFVAETAGSNGAEVIFILDDSSSMQSARDRTISGFNEFVSKHKHDQETSKIDTRVSLFKFNGTNVNCVYHRIPVAEVPLLTRQSYNPHGNTNLLDVLGAVIGHVNSLFYAMPREVRPSVIITVLTDGEENSSRVYTSNDVKQIVGKCERAHWGFQFLGANIDAFAVGSQFGFRQENTIQYDMASMDVAMASAAEMGARMKSALTRGLSGDAMYSATAFTTAERTRSAGGSHDGSK